ncbi:FtsX-like permease family protein [Microbacterium sp.]|uniref:FtsX-like permease family protein n=1 Tax=Microbacterium sp. TaxID=51671 RepID=UPI00333EF968
MRGPRAGATLRLARRQLLRTKGSSVLVAALIAVPVAAATAGVTFIESRTPTPEQRVTLELGRTQSWIEITGGADASRVQAIDMPFLTEVAQNDSGAPRNPEKDPPKGLEDANLPTGTDAIPIALSGGARMKTRDGIASFDVVSGDAWDPRLTGRFERLEGKAPQHPDEAMASPALLRRLGAEVGGDVQLPDEGKTYRIVGTMRAVDGSRGAETLFVPLAKDATGLDGPHALTWFLPGWQPDEARLAALNHAGYIAYARDLNLDPPAGARMQVREQSEQERWNILSVLSLGAAFAGILVALLSAAAMAVSARRQQRSLAVVSTVGARRRDVFRVILLQGGILGLAGGLGGAALGIGAVAVALPLVDPGVKGMFWSSWGLRVPWTIAVVVALAVIVGLLASAAPARAATHGDVLAALRGARRPVEMSRRRPVWGIVILVAGVAVVIGGGVLFAVAAAADWSAYARLAILWFVVLGVLLVLTSVILTGRSILQLVDLLLARCGTAARLASRDALANSSRTVPAFVAITASAAVAAFVLSALALSSAQTDRSYAWQGPKGSVIVSSWGTAVGKPPAFLIDARPDRIVPIASTVDSGIVPDGAEKLPEVVSVDTYQQGSDATAPTGWVAMMGTQIAVVQPDDLEALTGIALSSAELRDFAGGGVIAAEHAIGPGGKVSLSFWEQAAMAAADPSPLRSIELDVDIRQGNGTAWPVILSPTAAEEAGIEAFTTTWVGIFRTPVAVSAQDRMRADAETASRGDGIYSVFVEKGPDSTLPWLILVLAGVSVIVLAAAGITLGLARIERRDDDATLAAVGATRRLRRAVSAWQALIVVGVGCLIGVGIGVIGIWTATQSMPGYFLMQDLPFAWLALLGVGLPLGVALVSLTIRPTQAVLTRRTAIA